MANITHPESPGVQPTERRSTGRWTPWVLALLVLVSGFGLGALYAAGTPSDELASARTVSDPDPVAPAEQAGVAVAAQPVAEPSPRLDLGPTEVAFVANFPLLDFDWESVTLPTDEDFELRWVGRLGDEYFVVGIVWGSDGNQELITYRSTDGSGWSRSSSIEVPSGISLYQITGNDDGLVVVGEDWDARGARFTVYRTIDGFTWDEYEIPEVGDESSYVYLQSVGAGSRGLVVAMTIEHAPVEPPQILEIGGFTIQIEHRFGTYTLLNAVDEPVLTGSTDDIWNWQQNGQAVYHPDSGELITVVPWNVWEQAWAGAYEGGASGSPLPIPIGPDEPFQPPVVTIEWEDYTITLDEGAGLYEVVQGDSTIAVGPIDDLWRGPPPSFVNPETGETILEVTWEEWDRAEEASWANYEEIYYGEDWYHSDSIVLFTEDGSDWTQTEIGSGSGGSSIAIAALDDRFILMVSRYGEFGERREAWTSTDGIDWQVTDVEEGERYLHNIVNAGAGLMGLGDGPGGSGVWSSRDGLQWTSEFTVGPQDDGRYVWLSGLAHGSMGTVAVGNREGSYGFEPMRISTGGNTAEFDGDQVVLITDDTTGEELLVVTWGDVESGLVSEYAVYEDGETRFFSSDGDLIMAIPDELVEAARVEREEALRASIAQVLFLHDGNEWFEVDVESGSLDYIHGAVVGNDQIILLGVRGDGYGYWDHEPTGFSSEVIVLIGTPAG